MSSKSSVVFVASGAALALLCLVAVEPVRGYTAVIPKVKTINGKCIHPMYNEKIAAGQAFFPPGICEEHRCDSSKRSITINGCGKVMPPPGCKAEFDLIEKYPNCCRPKIVCQ